VQEVRRSAPGGGDESERPAVAIFRSPVFHAHETFVREHALGLVRYRPIVAGLEDKGNVPPELEGRILLAASAAERLAVRGLGLAGGLARRLRPFEPALVHAHFGPDGLLALPLARALGVPLVTTLHGYDVSLATARLLGSGSLSWARYALFRRRLFAGGALFLAVSEALRARALAVGFPPERTIVHRNGIDLARFRPTGGRLEPGLILHVGRLVEKKGTGLLLRALAELRRERTDARLVVLGDGPLRPRLIAQAMALGIADHVRFLGSRPSAEVASWMERAWLLAAPSVTAGDGDAEGLPTVIVEAAASGLPVVGSDHSGIPEAIVDGETGYVVPEGEVAPLAARIADLLDSPRLRTIMGLESRVLAEARFGRIRQGQRLEAHYDRLLGSAATPGPGEADNR
jgi:colanic acid/amylovoran biosynthesis glycosyltransferase